MKRVVSVLTFLVLTLVTQVGGAIFIVCWLANRFLLPQGLRGYRRGAANLLLFLCLYTVVTIFVVPPLAAISGRVPLPCHATADRPFAVAHPVYCALNRHYVDPRLENLLAELSRSLNRAFPGTATRFLDANFPFLAGFPLLPHLSHNDGRKVDIAYYYAMPNGSYLPGQLRSPIGYWAFEQPRESDQLVCGNRSWLTLRWDLIWLQGL